MLTYLIMNSVVWRGAKRA